MALRYIDGFDHESTVVKDPSLVYKGPSGTIDVSDYTSNAGGVASPTLSTTTPYSIGRSLFLSSSAALTKILDNQATWLVGFHLRLEDIATQRFLTFLDGSIVQLTVSYNITTQKIEVYRGDPTANLLGSSVHTFALYTWYWIEFKVLINSSIGTVELRVNGISEITLTAGNQNTQAGANAYANSIRLRASTGGADLLMDDLYIADGTAGLNDFIGECRIITTYPASDHDVTWDASAGSNFQCVDDATVNTTDYISTSTPGEVDRYNMGAVGLNGTVKGVQLCMVGRKDDAQNHSIHSILELDSTDFEGDAKALDIYYRTFTKLYEINPKTTSAWQVSEIDAAIVGVELAS